VIGGPPRLDDGDQLADDPGLVAAQLAGLDGRAIEARRARGASRRLVVAPGRIPGGLAGLVVLAGLDEGGDQLAEAVGVLLDIADGVLEDVEADDGRQRDEEADAGGDEGLGDAGHDVVHRALVPRVAELVKGLDDADDRAEQADEGGVVPEGSEEGHPPLELLADLAQLALGHVAHRLGPALVPAQRHAGHAGLERGAGGQQRLGPRHVLAKEGLVEPAPQPVRVVAVAAEEEPALQHRRQGHHRERQQQVEHPRAAEQRDLEQAFDDGCGSSGARQKQHETLPLGLT
jgi:hypothetical protein